MLKCVICVHSRRGHLRERAGAHADGHVRQHGFCAAQAVGRLLASTWLYNLCGPFVRRLSGVTRLRGVVCVVLTFSGMLGSLWPVRAEKIVGIPSSSVVVYIEF